MHESLFKAKRIDNGEWVEGALFDGEKYCVIGQQIKFSPDIENECKIVGYRVDRDTICRYTGLTDNNGNKIWENDIFKHYNRVKFEDHESYDLGVIVWDEKHCRFTNKDWIHNNRYVLNKDCVYEVIGNIFDNADLVKE